MISSFIPALTTAAKRVFADWLILAAALVTIALSAVLLSAGPIYADAVASTSLRKALVEAPVASASLEVGQRLQPADIEITDQLVRGEIDATFSVIGVEVWRHLTSESFALPEDPSTDQVEIVSVQAFEDIESHATIVEGTWPSVTPEGTVQVAMSRAAADQADIRSGDSLTLTSRRFSDLEVDVTLVGIFEPDDPSGSFWFDDEILRFGALDAGSFRTIGPVVTDEASLLDSFAPGRLEVTWRAQPSYDSLTVPDVPELRSRVSALAAELSQRFSEELSESTSGASQIQLDTDLPALLTESSRSLTVTRSSVLALLFQLAVLAGYALVLTAGLMVESRRTEMILLRSRGASPGFVFGLSLVEALILTVPAALAGPSIAAWLIGQFDTYGPLASIGLVIDPSPNPESYALSAIAAIGALLALVIPAYLSARSSHSAPRRQQRDQGTSGPQRLGIDIALLVLAGAVVWQLGELGPRVAARIQGRFGVDPLLLVAPAVGLLAGSVLALRLVPLLARVSERLAAGGRSTVLALSTWQIARRPKRYARSSLLLIMAVGIGFFTAAFSATWIRSQSVQASFRSGADLTVSPTRVIGDVPTDLQMSASHRAIPGVSESMGLHRQITHLERIDDGGYVVLLDAAKAGSVVRIDRRLAPQFESQMADMASRRPEIATVEIPGRPDRLGLRIDARHLPVDSHDEEEPAPAFVGRARLVVQDGEDVLHRLDLGVIPVDDGSHDLGVDLTLDAGGKLSPAYPVELVSIEIASVLPRTQSREVAIDVMPLVAEADGDWEVFDVDTDPSSWRIEQSALQVAVFNPEMVLVPTDDPGLSLLLTTGSFAGSPSVTHSVRPEGTELPEAIPVVTTEGFLAEATVEVGDTLRVSSLRIDRDTVEIIGTVGAFPTVEPGPGHVVVADLPTVQVMGLTPGGRLDTASEYWLSLEAEEAPVIEALESPPFSSNRVHSRADLAKSLSSDPVATGTIGALSLGFVAAAVFAAVGFAVSATMSARERLTEFALLRALGLSPRQLTSWISAEQGVLVLASVALGTVIGIVLTATVLPLISLTQSGLAAFPPVEIVYPWADIISLDLVILASLAVGVAVMSVALRRTGLGSAMRMGEDR